MSTRKAWDFALHIKGVSLTTLDLVRLAEYMKEFASLLGREASPKFAGMVKGSVVMRARDGGAHPYLTRQRILEATQEGAQANQPYHKLATLMRKDGAYGNIIDPNRHVLLTFARNPAADEATNVFTTYDTGEIDGVVVGIVGADDTVHVRLQAYGGKVHNITVRNMTMARELAARFRLDAVRVHVHGTWKRGGDGVWEPDAVYADHIEDLDQSSAQDVFRELAVIPGNDWSGLDDGQTLWQKIRGLDDCRP